MTDDSPFFVVRNGIVWACWLDGTPPVRMGREEAVQGAMGEYLLKSCPDRWKSLDRPLQSAWEAMDSRQIQPPNQRYEAINERANMRHAITIMGKVYTTGGSWEVTILDLSERGCRFRNRDGRLLPDAPFTIKLGPIGPLEAVVKWRSHGEVGAEFSVPLYPSVLEHITQHFDLRKQC